jgi:hypothetical protein
MHQVFSGMRNVAIGDIVYLAEAENDDPTYRLGQIVEACPGEDGCVRTVRVQYTNPGKPEGKRSPPKTTTRPIHQVAMVVPVEYVFEDDTCDNLIGSRCPKRVLKTREEVEAAEARRKDPAKVKGEEPKKGGAKPVVRKRRGRPKKSEKPAATGGEPQTEEQGATEAAVEAEALQEAGDQLPAVRRG